MVGLGGGWVGVVGELGWEEWLGWVVGELGVVDGVGWEEWLGWVVGGLGVVVAKE